MHTLISTTFTGARQLVVALLSTVLTPADDRPSPRSAPAQEVRTVTFGLDGTTYEIDLSPTDAAALRDDLATWVRQARRTNGSATRRGTNKARATAAPGGSATTIRQWARANGHTVSDRGRLPAVVRRAYDDAR
jgi:hypothetical protein